MKHINECKKCESAEIVKIEGKEIKGNVINQQRTNFLKEISITRFLCSNCGYTEEWVENHQDLKRIKQKISNVQERTAAIKDLVKQLDLESLS